MSEILCNSLTDEGNREMLPMFQRFQRTTHAGTSEERLRIYTWAELSAAAPASLWTRVPAPGSPPCGHRAGSVAGSEGGEADGTFSISESLQVS